MRKNFEQQLSIDIIPIEEVKIPKIIRDELPPTLKALQHIFITPELNREVFSILEDAILKDKKRTGRTGMDLWEILVLGVVRMTLDIDYDRLHDMANHHKLIRQIMGVARTFGEEEQYSRTTIRDNVKLLDSETIEKISVLVVKAGHQLLKKKEEKIRVKADTYVVERNVHFPTDINLLWDSGRKCLDKITDLIETSPIKGWRKTEYWYNELLNQSRRVSNACKSGGKDKEKREKVQATEYLRLARSLDKKITESKPKFEKSMKSITSIVLLDELDYYQEMLRKHIDLIERRLIKGEEIPHNEKIFSIFETHTEWKKKGKANNKVELGNNVLVASDQFHFFLAHKVIYQQNDVELPIPLADKLRNIYGEDEIESISFDRGGWSPDNKALLEMFIPQVIIPKKGKKNIQQQQEESSKTFKKLRKEHSAIESNINSLEHHGLNRCLDKGTDGLEKYVALGVLSYNLHRFGLALMRKQSQTKPFRRKAA